LRRETIPPKMGAEADVPSTGIREPFNTTIKLRGGKRR